VSLKEAILEAFISAILIFMVVVYFTWPLQSEEVRLLQVCGICGTTVPPRWESRAKCSASLLCAINIGGLVTAILVLRHTP